MCQVCLRPLCSNCTPHEFTHINKVVRFVSVVWSPTMKETSLTAHCSQCSREVRARHECTECSAALCQTCVEIETSMVSFLEEHSTDAQHRQKSFRQVHTPFDWIKPPTTWECKCLTAHGGGGHCSRCSDCKLIRSLISSALVDRATFPSLEILHSRFIHVLACGTDAIQ